MAVSEDHKMFGSIGGGIMEFRMVELAREHFKTPLEIFSKKLIHNTKDNPKSSGMICSGNQQVAFYPLDKEDLPLVDSILLSGKGNLIFTEKGFSFDTTDTGEKFSSVIKDEMIWTYIEQQGLKDHLIIFGAGHVSLALSNIFSHLGFYITVLDNRSFELTTFNDNHYAHSKKIIKYDNAGQFIGKGDNTYIVIMTFNHRDDQKILKQLIGKKLRYLGMMGSSEKVKTIFRNLGSDGITPEQLESVDAPIGLQINSRTPYEIAVSIAAKIISIKNED
jgi:xanthine dehydrogenase accessory factor